MPKSQIVPVELTKKNHKFYPKPDGSKVLNQEKVKI